MFYALFDWVIDVTNAPVFTIPPFGLAQMVDIFIVAIIFYLILRWIKRTHAWVLIRGIVSVLLLRLLAVVFQLDTLGWIMETFFAVGLVAIVVLFQPELRKVLEQMGRGEYLSSFKLEGDQKIYASDNSVNEIIDAANAMSDTFTGALIVIEQAIDLDEYERTGLAIDAQVSSQLLLNIFEKNTPLHDGAVIIKNNRLTAAKCILPLTAESLDSSLGTRHRAAIGISEVSDARVLVVSEETGTISVVIDGRITRDVSEQQIRGMLVHGVPAKQRFTLFKSKRKRKERD